MSLGTIKEFRTREQWAQIKNAVHLAKFEEGARLCVKHGFYARDIARNMLRDKNEGIFCPSAEELILLTERATSARS